jgi:hypothetical protein
MYYWLMIAREASNNYQLTIEDFGLNVQAVDKNPIDLSCHYKASFACLNGATASRSLAEFSIVRGSTNNLNHFAINAKIPFDRLTDETSRF